jgi:transposase
LTDAWFINNLIFMTFIGIDIGKSNFVAAFPKTTGYHTQTYPNTAAGIRKFMAATSPGDHHCVMEATGNYGFLLLYLLDQGGIAASMVNPKQIKALTSIKGIGITLATALIVTTGGFTYFDNAKQLSRFIGICPTCYQSGSSMNIKGGINRNGDASLRALLYIASWSAIRYNSACRECYQRLKANGKPSKVALIAVANKLVRQAFAIANSNSCYVDGFCSSQKNN